MKDLLLKSQMALGFFAIAMPAVSAQSLSDYDHVIITNVYTPLPGAADVIGTGDTDGSLDDQTFAISLPFDFSYNGIVSSTIYINTNGFIAFGGDCALVTPIFDGSSDEETGIIAACNADLVGASTGAFIRTGITGTIPFREFVIEWTNMDEWNNYLATDDADATSLNFQIVLHEGDGIPDAQSVDINYGAMTVAEDISISVGLRSGTDVSLLTSVTDWTALVATTDNMEQVPLSASVIPAAGTTITFTSAGVPLPVVLQNIAAYNDGRQNIVSWSSAREEQGDYFILERSTDGKNFSRLYQANAAGTPSAYSYTDHLPYKGINYYRIRIVNNDQTVIFSKVVSAVVNTEEAIILSPNPAENLVSLSGLGAYKGGQLCVINTSGQVMHTATISGDRFTWDVSGLSAGLYLIDIKADAAHKTMQLIRR